MAAAEEAFGFAGAWANPGLLLFLRRMPEPNRVRGRRGSAAATVGLRRSCLLGAHACRRRRLPRHTCLPGLHACPHRSLLLALPASGNLVCGRHPQGRHPPQAGIVRSRHSPLAGIHQGRHDHWQASSGGRHFLLAGIYCIGWVGSRTSDPIKPH
jgi:hypothetical protein